KVVGSITTGDQYGKNDENVCTRLINVMGMSCTLGLERAETAQKAEPLEKLHGGNCMEDQSGFAYHNIFFVDNMLYPPYRNISNQYTITTKIDKEHPAPFSFAETYSFMTTARIETSGSRYCEVRNLLERNKGHITAETMMDILRDKESGINMEGFFMTTGSMVSVVLTDPTLPEVHYITGTPDPERSVFKTFVFVKDIKQLKQNSSLGYGPDDTVKKIPRFQSKPHRKHPLFVKHEVVVALYFVVFFFTYLASKCS
uniref:Secernin 3 n=1 Tax=Hucho hucho TaxID=62062 RepID=A0A4W5NWZ9_9TELE